MDWNVDCSSVQGSGVSKSGKVFTMGYSDENLERSRKVQELEYKCTRSGMYDWNPTNTGFRLSRNCHTERLLRMHDPEHPQRLDKRGKWVQQLSTEEILAAPEKLTGVLRSECLEKA